MPKYTIIGTNVVTFKTIVDAPTIAEAVEAVSGRDVDTSDKGQPYASWCIVPGDIDKYDLSVVQVLCETDVTEQARKFIPND